MHEVHAYLQSSLHWYILEEEMSLYEQKKFNNVITIEHVLSSWKLLIPGGLKALSLSFQLDGSRSWNYVLVLIRDHSLAKVKSHWLKYVFLGCWSENMQKLFDVTADQSQDRLDGKVYWETGNVSPSIGNLNQILWYSNENLPA